MKKIISTLWMGSLAAVLLLGSALVARADEDRPMGGGDHGDGKMGAAIILKMQEKLGLTDSQVEKLKSAAKKEREEMKPVIKDLMMNTKALKEAVDANAKDSELTSLLNKLDSERRNLESLNNKYVNQYRSILTPTQQAKVALFMAKKKMDMMKKMGKGMMKHKMKHKEKEEGEND
jgi:Spy/CpxP family protein refolding chaperone